MTRADEERAVVDEIRENPIKIIRSLFTEGGTFARATLTSVGVDKVPVIMEVEVSDRVYLTIVAWLCDSQSYRQVTYEAYYATSSNGGMAWKVDSYGSCIEVVYKGLQRAVDGLALGEAMQQWTNMMNYYTNNRYADEEYAWFFPVGISNAEEFKGLLLHADTEWSK